MILTPTMTGIARVLHAHQQYDLFEQLQRDLNTIAQLLGVDAIADDEQ